MHDPPPGSTIDSWAVHDLSVLCSQQATLEPSVAAIRLKRVCGEKLETSATAIEPTDADHEDADWLFQTSKETTGLVHANIYIHSGHDRLPSSMYRLTSQGLRYLCNGPLSLQSR